MIIHKFGGTSVGDAERFANVAKIVADHSRSTPGDTQQPCVVVVSAMSGVTSQLITAARAAAEGKDAAAQRERALKRYYAWWYKHADQGYWDLLKKQRQEEEEKL